MSATLPTSPSAEGIEAGTQVTSAEQTGVPTVSLQSNTPVSADTALSRINPAEKVAIILSLLEPERARNIASQLDPGAVDRVITAFQQLRTVPRNLLLETVASFVTGVRSKTPLIRGGERRAQSLAEALGLDQQDTDDTYPGYTAETDSLSDDSSAWNRIVALDTDDLARLMSSQRPVIIAAVLRQLPPGKAGKTLSLLSEDLAIAVVAHMARGRFVSDDTFQTIARSLASVIDQGLEATGQDDDRRATAQLSAILNRCPLTRQIAVLDPLKDATEGVAEIEKNLIRFPSLHAVLPNAIVPSVFREIEDTTLHKALRYGATNAPETVDYLFANISQRLAEQIRQAVGDTPMPDAAAGEEAQTTVIGILLDWAEEERFGWTEPA